MSPRRIKRASVRAPLGGILLASEGRRIPKAATEVAAELALAAGAPVHVFAIARVHGVGFALPNPWLRPNATEWQEQREALEAELADLEGPKRRAAVEAIKTARSFGDLSENFEYHAAKNEQGLLEARIRKLRHRLQHAVTVEHDTDEHVGVGSIVEIEDEHGERMELQISSVGGVSPDRKSTRLNS